MKVVSFLSSCAVFATCALAGFPPLPKGTTITRIIPGHPGASISYKETTICETHAKGYAGYVHIPASELSSIQGEDSYNINTFFWYFEARNNASHAQTSIYFAGGPGSSSMYGAAQSGGPCTVLPDTNSTENNPWSWNENVNMLYVDQPVGVGFSYDVLVNATQDLLYLKPTDDDPTGIVPFESYGGSVPVENNTFLYGTFPTPSPARTANTTVIASIAMWHFSQIWFSSFPEYNTSDKRISLWGNSYGGYWVPATAEYMVRQNTKINAGTVKGKILHVAQIGWTNGCTDALYQVEWYPDQAYNNTYGLQVISKDVYKEAKQSFIKAGGCKDMILQCRELGDKLDPNYLGVNSDVNTACTEAIGYCSSAVLGPFDALSNRSDFDMTHFKPDGFPTSYLISYFNKAWVQEALGVPVNFTATSIPVSVGFFGAGDLARYAGKKSIEFLLASGVRVNMVYGDRDYRCPWNGAEKLSLQFEWSGKDRFNNAGYESIQSGCKRHGGVVRQHGNLTFSRVFQAGHDVASYAPQTAFEIFDRAMSERDVASGNIRTTGKHNAYSTKGPSSSFFIKNKALPPPPVNCNIQNLMASCTIEQYDALSNGTAVIVNSTVVKPAGGSPGALFNPFAQS